MDNGRNETSTGMSTRLGFVKEDERDRCSCEDTRDVIADRNGDETELLVMNKDGNETNTRI